MATNRAVIVICDSLRRDLITKQNSPTLWWLREYSTWCANHRSVYPSTTRVSSATIATGCRPAVHGLLGNTMVLNEPGLGLVCRSVGSPDFVERLRRLTGQTLRVPTLAERVRDHGGAVLFSNVSPGAAYFHDPNGHGYVYHRAGSFGPGRRPITGAEHLEIETGTDGDKTMTERFCSEVLKERQPRLATLWLSEPDATGHTFPLGSPTHLTAIKSADENVAQVLRTLEAMDPGLSNTLLLVGSDHGMETVVQMVNVDSALVDAKLKESQTSHDIVVASQGSAIVVHATDAAAARIDELSEWLQAQPWAGPVYRNGSLNALGIGTTKTLRLAVTMAKRNEPNTYGVRGLTSIAFDVTDPKNFIGFGQHGGCGHYEQLPFLAICGGGYSRRDVTTTTSLTDLAPTVLAFLGLPVLGTEGTTIRE